MNADVDFYEGPGWVDAPERPRRGRIARGLRRADGTVASVVVLAHRMRTDCAERMFAGTTKRAVLMCAGKPIPAWAAAAIQRHARIVGVVDPPDAGALPVLAHSRCAAGYACTGTAEAWWLDTANDAHACYAPICAACIEREDACLFFMGGIRTAPLRTLAHQLPAGMTFRPPQLLFRAPATRGT
jgi:hypothetical protein